MPITEHINALLRFEPVAPLVYTYPPRSAYRRDEAPPSIDDVWRKDFRQSGRELNLYIHIPFCRYRCGFCNLYTAIGGQSDLISEYTRAIVRQLYDSASIIQSRKLRTINIGGGTPSLLSISDYRQIFRALTEIYPGWREIVDEVSTEAAPDTIGGPAGAGPAYLEELRRLGVTRVNLGIQSLQDRELRQAGRAPANFKSVMNAVEIIKKVGIPNFSTDLIIGFAGQTDEAWDDSVERAISFAPDTISTYLLTIRPDAWFERTGLYASHGESLLYRRYERAREALYAVGYVYDSNIRYKIPGRGGLLQKVLQFRGVPVLGIGAGARSYTNTADYIVGGHNRPALSQISDYITAVSEGSLLPARGFIFDDNERIRKRLALDLFDLHLDELAPYGFSGVRDSFTPVLVALVNAGLLQEAGADHYQLTRKGYEYRDVVSGLFFSDRVKERDRGFYEAIRAESGVKGNMAAVLG